MLSFGLMRVSDPETFGSLAALLLVVGFSTEIVRSSVGETLLLFGDGRPLSIRGIWIGAFPLLATSLVAMVFIGWTTTLERALIVVFALSLALVLVQEILRYSAIAARRSDVALRMSLSWFVIQAPVTLVALTTEQAGLGIIIGWGLGCAAALMLGVVSWGSLAGQRHQNFFSRNRSTLVRFGFELVLDRGSAYLVMGVVGVVIGFVGLGQIHAARLLFTLANPALFLVPAMLIPVFEARPDRARRLLVACVGAAAVFSVIAAAAAWFNPAGLTALVVQENWEGARPLIPWVGLSFGLGVIRLVCRTYLRSFDRMPAVTNLRIMDSVVVAVTSIGGALSFGAVGAVVGRSGALGIGSLAWAREVTGIRPVDGSIAQP